MDIRPLVELARQQGNVASVRQVPSVGLAPSTLRAHAERVGLQRPHRGVLALAGVDLTMPLTRWWIALCAAGSPAWLGGLAALAARDIVRPPTTVDVVVPSDRKPSLPDGARLRRLAVDHEDLARRGRLPLLGVPAALSEVAALEPYDELLGAVAAAVQSGTTSLAEVECQAERRRTGGRALRRAVADLSGSRAQSALAQEVTQLLRGHGFTVDAEVEVVRGDGRRARLDLVVRGTRVAIEVDGHAAHSSRRQLARDRTRQNNLVLTGWTILRVDWLRLRTDAAGFLAEVHAAVAAEGS